MSNREPIAFAQTYFTRLRNRRSSRSALLKAERVSARGKLMQSEKELSRIIFDRLGDKESFGRIRGKGDSSLSGGRGTLGMKDRLNVNRGRPVADFLPTITIKAKDFANEIPNFNIKENSLRAELTITSERVKNNQEVLRLLVDRGIGFRKTLSTWAKGSAGAAIHRGYRDALAIGTETPST